MSEIVEIVQKPKKPTFTFMVKPKSYTAEEVQNMSDDEFAEKIPPVVGCSTLYCSHCKRETLIAENWLYAFRNRCVEGFKGRTGLFQGMALPKTCDKQLKTDHQRGHIQNTANRILRNPLATEEEKREAEEWRRSSLEAMGVKTKPSKHVPK